MNRRFTATIIASVILTGLGYRSLAELKDNPYQVIVDRNPFGLRPPPPPPPPPGSETPPPPPPPDIKLVGITTLLGPPKVYLEFTDAQTKKVERPPALVEGDTFKNSILIVSIDPENNRVKVKNGDAESWLDFDKNGHKPGGGGGPAPVPHPAFPAAGAVPPAPGASVSGMNPVPANTPMRGGLVGGNTPTVAAPTPNAGVPNYNPAATTALGGYQRPIRTEGAGAGLVGGAGSPNAAPSTPTPTTAKPTMTPEQAQAIIEARRLQLEQQGNPMSRILPPTALGQQLKNLTPPAPGQ